MCLIGALSNTQLSAFKLASISPTILFLLGIHSTIPFTHTLLKFKIYFCGSKNIYILWYTLRNQSRRNKGRKEEKQWSSGSCFTPSLYCSACSTVGQTSCWMAGSWECCFTDTMDVHPHNTFSPF